MPAASEKGYESGWFRGLTPNVVRLGLVSFFVDVSSEMLYPVIPVFLSVVLGAGPVVIGVIEGLAGATASVLKTLSGWWSDKSGRRRIFIFSGYGLSAVSKPFFALAAGWPMVLVARVAERFGKGLRTSARDALLADSVDEEFRGKAFGWHRAMDTLGAVVGPIIAIAFLGLVGTGQGKLRLIFLVSFIPAAVGTLLVLAVREKRSMPKPRAPSIGWSSLPRSFRRYLIAWGVFMLANSSDMFLVLRAKEVFGSAAGAEASLHGEAGTVEAIWAYVLYNLVYTAASPVLGHLSDKIDRKKVLIGGLVVFALVYVGFGLAEGGLLIWVLFAVYGLFTAATEGVGKALAVDLVGKDIRASALGLLGTVEGLAAIVASVVAGVLYQGVGAWAAFVYGAAGAAAGALLLSQLGGRAKEQPAWVGTEEV